MARPQSGLRSGLGPTRHFCRGNSRSGSQPELVRDYPTFFAGQTQNDPLEGKPDGSKDARRYCGHGSSGVAFSIMPRLTNKGVPLTEDEVQAIRDDLGIVDVDLSEIESELSSINGGLSSITGDLSDLQTQVDNLPEIDATNVQAALADDPAGARTSANAATRRPYIHGPNHGMRAFRARLDRGETGALLFLSDSTGVPSDSWIRLFAVDLAARYPNHRVEFRQCDFNGTNAIPTLTVLQAGSERQHWLFGTTVTTNRALVPGATLREQMGGQYGGIEIEMAPTANAALTGGYPTGGVELGGTAANPYYFYLDMSASGRLNLNWSDGVGFRTASSTSGQPVPALVVGTYVRYRALVNTNNGGARTVDFHYSTNQGQTWTKIGNTITVAGTADLLASTTQSWGVGAANNSNCVVGYKYSHFQIFKGANYEPLAPERIDSFMVVAGATSNTPALGGVGTIYLDVVAVNGAGIASTAWFGATLPGYAWNLLRDRTHDVCLISSSHNDVFLKDASWALRMDSLRTLVTGRAAVGPTFLHVCQNPETADYQAPEILKQHNYRQAGIIGYAARKGSPALDAYQAFLDDGRAVRGVLVREFTTPPTKDGVHPTPEGYRVWANALMNSVFLDGTNETL